MREILFRGKDTVTQDFIYGDLVREDSKSLIFSNNQMWHEVIPETVGQYTGLDENAYEDTSRNERIFEGDKVMFIDGEVLVVEWNDDTCMFQYSDGSPINDGNRYAIHRKIKGNIHDKKRKQ